MEIAVGVSIAIFLLGLAYQAGRHSVRIEKLEEWRIEQREQHAEMLERFDRIDDRFRGLSVR